MFNKFKEKLRFSAPKGANLSVSRDYYLSVLCSSAVLPAPANVCNPKGDHQAITGFLAPLGSSDKADLGRAMGRGAYVAASLDRKTLLKLMVMPRDESGFDPQTFLNSELSAEYPLEVRRRIAATWHLVQVSFESFHPEVYCSLDFILDLATRLGILADGVVADPLARSYRLPENIRMTERLHLSVDVREHVAIHRGKNGCFTAGLAKFALPEIEINDISDPTCDMATRLLMTLGQQALLGQKLELEAIVGPFMVTRSQHDPGRFELIPCKGGSCDDALKCLSTN